MEPYELAQQLLLYIEAFLVIITLIFASTWKIKKGKASFIVFLSLLFSGYLNVIVFVIVIKYGLNSYSYIRAFSILNSLLVLSIIISLLIYVIISRILKPIAKSKARPFFLVFFMMYLCGILTQIIFSFITAAKLIAFTTDSTSYKVLMTIDYFIIFLSIIFLLLFTMLMRNIIPDRIIVDKSNNMLPAAEFGEISKSNRKIFAGLLLAFGGVVGLFAGGNFPFNPTLGTLLTFILCLISGIMAFVGGARKMVVSLAIIALAFTGLTVVMSPRHWILGGIWLFDIVALIVVFVGVLSAAV